MFKYQKMASLTRDALMAKLAEHNPVPHDYWMFRVQLSNQLLLSVCCPPTYTPDDCPAKGPDRISMLLFVPVNDEWTPCSTTSKEYRSEPTSETTVAWLRGYIEAMKTVCI